MLTYDYKQKFTVVKKGRSFQNTDMALNSEGSKSTRCSRSRDQHARALTSHQAGLQCRLVPPTTQSGVELSPGDSSDLLVSHGRRD